jgi:ribosomal protein S18 acetylase RimI-like enzyme
MTPNRDERVRMERAHVQAWPALHTARIDGWLWRASGGGSQRANSVSTIDFTGTDLLATIETVERRYRALGSIARFQTFDETKPPELPDRLRALGYQPSEATTTMFRRPQHVTTPQDVQRQHTAWPDWTDTYTGQITESRRAVNVQILANIPAPRMFFGCRRDGRIVATGLCVIARGCAVVECVATHAEARRQGAAREVMQALEAWAAAQPIDLIGLQVVSTNVPAIRLYQQLGYTQGATNRFWTRDAT